MKKEVRHLRDKAVNALTLSIEHFNRPFDCGRTETVLILLDHAFEMLLKSAIRHRNGKIRQSEKQTIGFDACVRKALTDGGIKFINEEQALTLRAINRQRDAAQHYLVDISEHQLYFYARAGVTLFRRIYENVFNDELLLALPERVLPISTSAPKDLITLFDAEIDEIRQLIAPGARKKMEAVAKVRSLAVLESAVNGNSEQPSDRELGKLCDRISEGVEWKSIFSGVASINIVAEGDGPTLSLRLTKNEGTPVRLLKEGEDTEGVIAIRHVNELDYYSLGATDLAKKIGLTVPKLRAVINHLNLRKDLVFFKEIRVGKVSYNRYSQKTISVIKDCLKNENIEEIWHEQRNKWGLKA